MAKKEIVKIENFNVNALEEIKGKKELITKTVKENPFVEITDNKTYEEAKKSRTALRTLRTDFEKEEKTLLNAVKTKITEPIKEIYSEFKNEVSPHEEKQQTEVKRYEEVKEEEKREKERIEEARKQNHRNNLDLFFTHNKNLIENLTFEQLPFEIQFKIDDQVFSNETFEDFADVFESKIEVLKFQLADKEKTLREKEDIRLQQVKLEEERKEAERVSNIKKSIDYFYSTWVDLFSDMKFKNLKEITEKFENEKPLACDEFQPEYAEKRASLVRMLEAKTSILKQAESQRIEAEKIAEQKKQIEEKIFEIRKSKLLSINNVKFIDNLFTLENFSNIDFSNQVSKEKLIELTDEKFNAFLEEFEAIAEENKKWIEKGIEKLNDPNLLESFTEEIIVTEAVVVSEVLEPEFEEVEVTQTHFIKIGTPTTIGELKELIKDYSDLTPFNFRNQPIQSLFEIGLSDDNIIICFQENEPT